eukprot:NODE_107_length_19843_cov_0.502077.p4 type:complete len:442 gc:universal NODE_107_length_19843_cov_0.502077:7287-5962(-)
MILFPVQVNNMGWENLSIDDIFILQKQKSFESKLFTNIMGTLTSIMDYSQLPFRLIIFRDQTTYAIASSDSQKGLEKDLKSLKEDVLTQLNDLEDKEDRCNYVYTKLMSMNSSNKDVNVLNAERTFHELFQINQEEKLVAYYSCSYKLSQGWMYISHNYLCYYSFIMGQEIKETIKLKDIQQISKDNAVKNLVSGGIQIIAADKTYHFINLFHLQETIEVLESLGTKAVERLLKTAAADSLPGQNLSNMHSDRKKQDNSEIDVKKERKDQTLRFNYNLPDSEHVILDGTCNVNQGKFINLFGYFALSETFFCFTAQHKELTFVLPLFVVRTVERRESDESQRLPGVLLIKTFHYLWLSFIFMGNSECTGKQLEDKFLKLFLQRLKQQKPIVNRVSVFVCNLKSQQDYLASINRSIRTPSNAQPNLGEVYGYPTSESYLSLI